MKNKRLVLGSLSCSLFLGSCGGDAGTTPTTPTTPSTPTSVATSVELSDSQLTFAALTATTQLTATVKDQNGSTMTSSAVMWTTTASAVATVSSTGLVTSVADGMATITARSGSASATATVTVSQVMVGLVLSDSILTFASLADTTQVTATVIDANDQAIGGAVATWATSDSQVATVSSTGLVTSVADGTSTVTATSESFSAIATVTVAQVASTVEVSQTTHYFTTIGDTVSVTATVLDEGGTEVSSAAVTWTSSSTIVATVSSSGLITAVADGTATVTATSDSASTTIDITVNQGGLVVDAITAIWTEGSAATITGSGFSATPSSNTVMVDGLAASITSASATELQITVPTSTCKPSRVTDVAVTVATYGDTATVGVQPGETVWSIGLGGGIYADGGDCFHIDAGSSSEKYIVGVYSSSESAASLTPYTQTAITGSVLAGTVAPNISLMSEDVGYFEAPVTAFDNRLPETRAPSQQVFIDPEREAERLAHAEAEARRWEAGLGMMEEMTLRGITPEVIATEGAAAAGGITARSIGDTMVIKVPDASCTEYTSINTVVRYVGTYGLYLEDVANPLDPSFTASEYATWDATFSGTTLPKLVEYYGERSDNVGFGIDSSDRIGVVLTKELNIKGGVSGFVQPVDFYPTSTCPSSNYAELFYAHVPDPDGIHGDARTREHVSSGMPALLAHEVAHIVQLTQSIHRTAAYKAVWEIEGGATLAEWLVGNEVLSHGGAGQNLSAAQFIEGFSWYRDLWSDMSYYFGYSSSGHVSGAPEQCTWLEREPPGVCGGGTRAVYGVPALLLRFILDVWGPTYSGGEAALMRDLTSSAEIGYDNLVTKTGASSIGLIQTLFGLNLYSDGRAGVAQGTYTSALTYFDFTDIMSLVSSGNNIDRSLSFYTSSDAAPTSSHSVRGGSTSYLEWEPPSSHAPTSILWTTPDGDELPEAIGMWIFRIR